MNVTTLACLQLEAKVHYDMVVRCATPYRPPWYRRLLFLCLLGSACLFTWHKADPQVRENLFQRGHFDLSSFPLRAMPYRPPWYRRLLFLCLLGSACLFTWHKADPQVRENLFQRRHFDWSSFPLVPRPSVLPGTGGSSSSAYSALPASSPGTRLTPR